LDAPVRRWRWNPFLAYTMPIVMANFQLIRFVVNFLGGLGFPGILFDTQIVFAVWYWWKH
jgi:hypothetical protein